MKNILLAVVSLLLCMFLAEAGLRVLAYYQDRALLSEAPLSKKSLPPGTEVEGMGHLIRLSDDASLIYELKPDMDLSYTQKYYDVTSMRAVDASHYLVKTNSEGFRDREHEPEKPAGVTRVLGIGDSVMYGMGVEQDETYLSLLEGLLNREAGAGRWETINTAVPGYNTFLEVEMLKHRGLRYSPDIVVLGFCGNDYSLPQFIRNSRDVLSTKSSFLYNFIAERLAGVRLGEKSGMSGFELVPTELDAGLSRVPEQYRHMVGWDAFHNSMNELKSLSQEYGFKVVVLFFVDDHFSGGVSSSNSPRALAWSLGFYTVDVRKSLDSYMSLNGIKDYVGSPLSVNAHDPHPSAIAHSIAARELFIRIRQLGFN